MFLFKQKKIISQINKYFEWKKILYPFSAIGSRDKLLNLVNEIGLEDIYDVDISHIEKMNAFLDKINGYFEKESYRVALRCLIRYHKNIESQKLKEYLYPKDIMTSVKKQIVKEEKPVLTLEYFREMGRKGGMKTLKTHGLSHFKKIRSYPQVRATTPLSRKLQGI